jgi:myosin heavy subunit
MRFNQDGNLDGAKIFDYMLEKSRVTLDFPNERNFLIFYYLVAGLEKSTMEKFQLQDIQSHK